MINEDKKVIVTTYGQGRKIEKISVNLFEKNYFYNIGFDDDKKDNASILCKLINNIELKNDSWIFARIININNPYKISNFIPFKFSEIIIKLDDVSIQKVLKEIIDNKVILNAIRTEDENVKSKILINMSNDEKEKFKEDLARAESILVTDIKDAQEEIISVIRHLIECGEIISPYISEDELIESK